MFLTDAQIVPLLAAQLKIDLATGTLDPFWLTLLATAHSRAYNEIVMRLVQRGYTQAQVDAWDRGAEFEQDLAVFWALSQGAGLQADADLKGVERLDRRAELDTVSVLNAGVLISPGSAGRIGFGTHDDTNSIFRFKKKPGTCIDGPDGTYRTHW